MKKVQSTALIGFLVTLALSSTAVLAVQVDADVDKRIVALGGSLTVTATITDDNNTAGNFEYRIAVIGPGQKDGGERVVICDSQAQNTNGVANVSFVCNIPNITGLQELGIQNADDRFVIPLKGGVAVIDPATNETVKEHGKALIVNTGKISTRLDSVLDRINAFIDRAQNLITRCDNITARAEEAGAENVIERCTSFQERVQDKIDKALESKERINNLLSSLDNTTFDIDNLKGSLFNFGNGLKDFRVDTGDIKGFLEGARADLEKRVAKEIVDRAKERAQQLRENLLRQKERIQERLAEIESKVAERRSSSGASESSGEGGG